MGGVAVYGGGCAAAVYGLQALWGLGGLRCWGGSWAQLHSGAGEVEHFAARAGYWCDFTRFEHYNDYTLEEVDLFAAYVIPENVWYLIPAAQLVRDGKRGAMLCPVVQPVKKNTFRYEGYKDAWWLLTKTRRGLAMCGRGR